MIRVTRINDQPFVVNVDFLKYIEETPDTIITLKGGEKIIVKESADEIISQAVEYIRSTRFPPGMDS
ncbi:MAG: flagellar FlbD family protein [Planctomycetes bacterium]|nr:flagellar FlbD family protein [Planctomycetota bacterium]